MPKGSQITLLCKAKTKTTMLCGVKQMASATPILQQSSWGPGLYDFHHPDIDGQPIVRLVQPEYGTEHTEDQRGEKQQNAIIISSGEEGPPDDDPYSSDDDPHPNNDDPYPNDNDSGDGHTGVGDSLNPKGMHHYSEDLWDKTCRLFGVGTDVRHVILDVRNKKALQIRAHTGVG
ncbi:hypothetical protein DL764_003821 [Monosporascus ibericus]|uniref:Uncharacterized protein n=1 Tax=Monosporascus ibericus TaxID=155417 RepID=A0A4Q4TF02_9PEZI|nr:hypothetical protein DL764_003821 [Monosporascus ibericus]